MSKKSKSTTEPWKPAQGQILGAGNALTSAYNQNAPGIQEATNSITGLLPGMIDKYQQGDAGVNAARGYNTDVLGGKYLGDGNPYLQGMIDRSTNDTVNATQAALGLKGLSGGSDYAGLIADRVNQNSLGMRYQDYGAERDRMATASGQSPGLAAADVIQITPMMAALQAGSAPLDAAGQYAGGLGGLFGGYGTTTQKQGAGSMLGGLLGAGLAGWASGGFGAPKGGFF